MALGPEARADARGEYLHRQSQDKRILKKIHARLKDGDHNGHSGFEKPEALKHSLPAFGHAASTTGIAWSIVSKATKFNSPN